MRSISIGRPRRRALNAVCVLAILTGCSGAGDETSDETSDVPDTPEVTVSPPASRLTPFCQAMIELSDQLETDPPDDATSLIIETYEAILDDVPEEIEPDFLVVLADLQAGIPAAEQSAGSEDAPDTTGPAGDSVEDFDAEGRVPTGDDSAERLSGYIDLACRDNVNNPGPPATEPLDDLTLDDDTGDTADPEN